MAKTSVTYHAPVDDNPVVTMGGVRFFDDQPTEVDADTHGALLRKLRNNPHFEVAGDVPDDDAPDVDLPHDDASELRAVHKGGGSYAIVRGDAQVKGGLSKADAQAFNALSADDREAYVA